MVAFNAHDSSSGDTQISRAKMADTYETGSDERVFQAHQDIDRRLGVGEHPLGIEESRERARFIRYGLFQQIM